MTSVLTYRGAAEDWMQRLPLGDGALGAMCQGATPYARFTLNHDTAWSGSWPRPEEGPTASAARAALARARDHLTAGRAAAAERDLAELQSGHSQAYLPFADLEIRRDGPTTLLPSRVLDLIEGTHEVDDGGVAETTFIHDGVLVHRVRGARVTGVHVTSPLWTTGRGRTADGVHLVVRMPVDVAPGHEPGSPPVRWGDGSETVVEGAVVVRVLPADDDGQSVLATISTTFAGIGRAPQGSGADALTAATARLDAAAAIGAAELEHRHRAGHRAVMERVRLSVVADPPPPERSTAERVRIAAADGDPVRSDPALAVLLFDYGRYLLWSASRGGTLPATLQGIWNHSMQPPWSSNYTVNINTEMNYWGAHVAALSESTVPFADLLLAVAESGRRTARTLYDAPGWVCHHNTDAWAFTGIAGAGVGEANWAFWPQAGPWLIQQLWEAAEFGVASDAEIAAWWPAIRGAAEFSLSWLHRDADGRWSTAPATSPENTYRDADGFSVGIDTTSALDLQLMRRLFRIVDAAATRLGVTDDPVVADARLRADELPRTPDIGRDGLPVEWARERVAEDPHHRHVSPLFWLYPGEADGAAEDLEAAAAMLARRGDDSAGWSVAWKAALWARLGRPDKVDDILAHLIRPSHEMDGPFGGGLYPDLLASHPPFQIDGNLGYVAAIAETLVQSHDGIELLPALLPAWTEGEVVGLVARPGISVSIRWADGALQEARLRSRAGTHRIRVHWRGAQAVRVIDSDHDTILLPGDFAVAGPA